MGVEPVAASDWAHGRHGPDGGDRRYRRHRAHGATRLIEQLAQVGSIPGDDEGAIGLQGGRVEGCAGGHDLHDFCGGRGGGPGDGGQLSFHMQDAARDPVVVGLERLDERQLMGDEAGGFLAIAAGFGAGCVEQGPLEGAPADLVRLEHAAVDEQDAGLFGGAGGRAAERFLEPFDGELPGEVVVDGAGRRLAGVLGGYAFAGFGARSGRAAGVGAVGGQAARGDGRLWGGG